MKKQKKIEYDRMDYHTFSTRDMKLKERRKLDIGDIWMNRIKCKKCGDIITSNNRHDFKYCKCRAVFVDGGSWYGNVGGDKTVIEEMYEYFDDTRDEGIDK